MKKFLSIALSVALLLCSMLNMPIFTISVAAAATPTSEWVSASPKAPVTSNMAQSDLLDELMETYTSFVVVRQRQLGGSHYAYTEAISDTIVESGTLNTPNLEETPYRAGAELVLVELEKSGSQVKKTETVLLSDSNGVIRDPDVSEDGTKVLFSWSNQKKSDDYHLYEYDLLTDKYRQLTFGVGVADTEPKYMPNGDIIFSSTRMTQIIDCYVTPVSNLYLCGPNGENIVRVGYDQVHTTYPTLTEDGRVLYTRWDYNDRSQIYTQAIFQMFPDGTNQTEVYGNNSNFPPSLIHARQVAGTTDKYIAIAAGHHTYQAGKLVIVDTSKGRNSLDSLTFIHPGEEAGVDIDVDGGYYDKYGQCGIIYKYPYSVTEDLFLVSSADIGHDSRGHAEERTGWGTSAGSWGNSTPIKIYVMNTAGEKIELVGMSGSIGASQIVPVAKRTLFERASMVNYGSNTGTYYIGNIYEGDGLKGVPCGTAKYLRIVALDYRAYTAGCVGVSDTSIHKTNSGQAFNPVSVGNGSWDVKKVLGIVDIYEDGSALFKVPSETPVYFQVLDENYAMIQSMRSWSTLMPGETFSCVGCHEDKNMVPPAASTTTIAMSKGVQEIRAEAWQDEDHDPYGEVDGFSYLEEIQPILDESCVQCHNDLDAAKRAVGISSMTSQDPIKATSDSSSSETVDETVIFPIESQWQYVIDQTPADDWYTYDFDDSSWSTGKGLFGDLGSANTKWDGDGSYIWLRREFTLTQNDLTALSGKVLFLNIYYDESPQVYLNGELVYSASGSINAYETRDLKLSSTSLLKEGTNVIAVRADNLGNWGNRIDIGLSAKAYSGNAFSLESYRFGTVATEGALNADGTVKTQGPGVGKAFPLSYLYLTGSNGLSFRNATAKTTLISWIHTMSDAEMLDPYTAGSSQSRLITMLREKHSGVTLTDAQIRAIEAWIDLGVPCMGSYSENNIWDSNQIRWAEESQNKRDFYNTMNDLARDARAADDDLAVPEIGISYDSYGLVYDDAYAFATATRLEIPQRYAAGDVITITLPAGEYYLGLTLNSRMGEAILYVPNGVYTYTVPSGFLPDSYAPTFGSNSFNTITARVISGEELGERHNLSVNPYDTATSSNAYPHVTANGSYNDTTDAVRNAIDGISGNKGYGAYPNQSWGAATSGNSWMQVDFGREVSVDEIVLKLRADFEDNHDTYWKTGTLEFSDGSTVNITIDKTSDAQVFTFEQTKTTTYIKLKDLVKADTGNTFVGISELAVYGTEKKVVPHDINVVYTSGSTVYSDTTLTQSSATQLSVPKKYAGGDTVTVTLPDGEKYLGLTLNNAMGEAILYVPTGVYTYTMPTSAVMTAAYEPTFASNTTNTITARVVEEKELAKRRNLTFNPYDLDSGTSAYPHVTASDWHASNAMFAPRNIADGVTQNQSHNSWPYQSWGPSSDSNAKWLMIDFGHEVYVNEIAVYLRDTDASGHTYYKSATLEFSNGTKKDVTFTSTMDKQTIKFDTVKTTYVKVTNLAKADTSKSWAGITELEVYGSEYELKFTPGDLNDDGRINTADGLMLMRHLNGWSVTIAQPDAMDVNADNKVNTADGLILMRYLNGWKVTLG